MPIPYSLLRRLLFSLEPENSHTLTLNAMSLLDKLGLLTSLFTTKPDKPVQSKKVLGLTFKHPVGLAAGLDKNGDHMAALAKLGFAFIEVGTVTPKPQSGNPKPRLFRLKSQEALINRMGFNNKGMAHLARRLQQRPRDIVVGVNIGKNKDTAQVRAVDDYVACFRCLAFGADYVTVNISSPNTQGLRDLQHGKACESLLSALKSEQRAYSLTNNRYVPLLVKVSPDLSKEDLLEFSHTLKSAEIDGVIATNTTMGRQGVEESGYEQEAGGLSGAPLYAKSLTTVQTLRQEMGADFPLVAVGGIGTVEQGREMLQAGADLLQVYTGLIYQGPELVSQLAEMPPL